VIYRIPKVLILSHMWWGRMHLLLGIHHTLVWNRVLQNSQGWLLQILLWSLLRGRRHWRTWCVHGIFHQFEVSNLGAMMSIMTMLTTKITREVHLEVFFLLFLPWNLFLFPPWGFWLPWFWLPQIGWFCWGLFPPGPGLLLFQFFPFFLALFD
jgi:hypothetical protein